MANYILSCCSTADLSKQHFLDRDIKYICFHYELDGKEYADDLPENPPRPPRSMSRNLWSTLNRS